MGESSSTIQANKVRFDSLGYGYQDTLPHQRRKETILDLVREAIRPRDIWLNPKDHTLRVSEIGIGNGFLSEGYRSIFEGLPFPTSITGVDLNSTMLADLQKKGIIDMGVLALAEKLPMAAESQDLVVMSEVLEHTRTPRFPLEELYRVLKPRGKFVGSVPNMAQLWDRIAMLSGDAPHQVARKIGDPTFTHESHFTVNLLKEALRKAGFTEIEIKTNLVRLLRKDDGTAFPFLSEIIKNTAPGLGDRLIWTASKQGSPLLSEGGIPTLYLVSGSPRTGKSTLSHTLSQKKDIDIVSITDIRSQQTSGDPKFVPQELEEAYVSSVDIIRDLLQSGQSAIWEGTFRSRESREKIKSLIRRCPSGYRIIPIELRASSDIIARRVEATQKEHLDRDVTPQRAVQLSESHPQLPGAFVYDTSAMSVEDIVGSVLKI